MGRRVRSNCSPIDSAMEKYHNDIGNRLSGVFLPPQNNENGEPLADDFCMLTLDTRRVNSVRVKGKTNTPVLTLADINRLSGSPSTPKATSDSTLCNQQQNDSHTPEDTSQKASTLPAMPVSTPRGSAQSLTRSEQDGYGKDKTRLVDKLTRALFQRKHTCARCKRKSRSCMPNKTFSASEKHYTCLKCRDKSKALKVLFSGKSSFNKEASEPTDSVCSSFVTPKTSHAQPRTCLKDSGYETVTSCSTVSSSYSAFTNTATTTSGEDVQQPSQCENCQHREDSESRIMPSAKDGSCITDIACADCDPNCKPTNKNTEMCQFMSVGSDGSQYLLKQIKQNCFLQEYDGYLPESVERLNNHTDEEGLSVPSKLNFEGFVDDGGLGGRVIYPVLTPDVDADAESKACHTCNTTSKPCFRLPWAGGWICEDCLDGVC